VRGAFASEPIGAQVPASLTGRDPAVLIQVLDRKIIEASSLYSPL
jgi:hypothetical protein